MDPFINEDEFVSQDGESLQPKANPIKRRKKKDIQPNLHGKTIEDILGLANKMATSDLSKFSIDSIPIEHQLVDDITDMSPILKKTIDKGDNVIKTYGEFSKDLFLSLFKPFPELLAEDEMQPNYTLNQSLMENLTDDPQYTVLKDYCQLDEFSSALAANTMHETAIQKLEELKDELKRAGGPNMIDDINKAIASQDQLKDLMEKAQALQQMRQEILDAGGDPSAFDQMAGQMAMTLAQAMQVADAAAKQYQKVMQDDPNQLQRVQEAVGQGVKQAIQNVSQARDYINAWGFDSANGVRIPFDNKLRAIEKIRKSKKLKKFTDLIGALREMAKKEQKAKTINGRSDIIGVRTGSNLSLVLPSEKMLLNNPITRKDFLKRFNENALMQYEMNSMEKKGKGPIVCCVDDSGSMEGPCETWAKSFAVALVDIAQKQKRSYCYIPFDSSVRQSDIVILEKGNLDPMKIVEMCEMHYGGGTNFQRPLEEALRILELAMFKKGDIIFVTDGDCSLSSDFIRKFKEIKERKEFSCRGVLINVDGGGVSKASLEPFCDDIIVLSDIVDLTGESTVAQQVFHDL